MYTRQEEEVCDSGRGNNTHRVRKGTEGKGGLVVDSAQADLTIKGVSWKGVRN